MGQAIGVAYQRRAIKDPGFPFSGEIAERIKTPQFAAALITEHSPSMLGPALAELRRMVYFTEMNPEVLELLRNSAREDASYAFDGAEVEKAVRFNRDLDQDILGETDPLLIEPLGRLGEDLFSPYKRDLSEQELLGWFQATGDEQYLMWAVAEYIRTATDESAIVSEMSEYLDLFTGAGQWGSSRFYAVALLKMNPWPAVLAFRRGQWLCQKFGRQYKELLLACASLPPDELSGSLKLFVRDFVPQHGERRSG
jgi:hypothetical protein